MKEILCIAAATVLRIMAATLIVCGGILGGWHIVKDALFATALLVLARRVSAKKEVSE